MKKFIQKIRETGDLESMAKACVTVSTLNRNKEVEVPAGAVEAMMCSLLEDDEGLKELFYDEAFNYAISAVVEAIKEEVKGIKIEPVTDKSVISELLGILGTVTEALKNMDDDLK